MVMVNVEEELEGREQRIDLIKTLYACMELSIKKKKKLLCQRRGGVMGESIAHSSGLTFSYQRHVDTGPSDQKKKGTMKTFD